LGKTHLLQAIGNGVDAVAGFRIQYLSSEKLVSSIVSSIRNHSIQELKDNLCRLDMIIVDDVQFMAGKEKTQEEFFHIFNALYERNKQIVLSSDRPPALLLLLKKDSNLVSREA